MEIQNRVKSAGALCFTWLRRICPGLLMVLSLGAMDLNGDTWTMKAAWDWHLPRKTETQQRELVRFAHELGFNTLITRDPTEAMVEEGRALGVRLIAVVYPYATDVFEAQHPECFQKMRPEEHRMQEALRPLNWTELTAYSYLWVSLVQFREILCFEYPEAQAELKRRVEAGLEFADGVALDGFGFLNHYGCFCTRCEGIRKEISEANPDLPRVGVMARMSEASLVKISRVLYEHAKSIKPGAIVTNHVWPPFRPNLYYASRLKLDFCSQTISWYYPPDWSLEKVAFEASEMKRLEDPESNRFIAFIGLNPDPDLARSPERVAKELKIALKYGEGSLVFSSLKALKDQPEIEAVVKAALSK